MVYFAGIALISTATILLELALLRIFAVQQFYHFAFMAISLALLGAGASGSLLSVLRRRLSPLVLCLLFGLSTIGAFLVLNYLPFDSFSIAWDRRQVLYLAIYFLVAAIPFLFSGLVVGGELADPGGLGNEVARRAVGSHQVYGANLIGSSLGAVVALPLLSAFGGVGAVICAAVLGAAAGLLFGLLELKGSGGSRVKWAGMLSLASLLVAALAALVRPPAILEQQLSPYKTLSVLLQAMDAKHTVSESDASARIDIVESSTIHIMPGLSLLSPVRPPTQAGLMLNGDSLAPITSLDPHSENARQLAYSMPIGLAFALRPGAPALVLEAGTGTDVLLALAAGAAEVTAVEENELLLKTIREDYGDFTYHLYEDPLVTVVNQSGRVFAQQHGGRSGDGYSLVIISLAEPHRPVTSGAFSLNEEYTYTVEAFRDYLQLLEQDGLLAVTRWLQAPPSESGRTFGTLVTALESSGRDPAQHLIAFRTLRTMTFLASLQPFQEEELAAFRDYLARRSYDPVYFPGITEDELNRFNVLEEPIYHQLLVQLLADPQEVYAKSRFDIEPTTDDRPFFYHYFKWRQTPEILAGLGYNWQPFGGSGYFVLVALLIVVLLASALLIAGPLLIRSIFWKDLGKSSQDGQPPIRRWRVFLYFALLGLAFLFVEIPLSQRFILILDQPVTALAVVLFAILLSSGIGSLTIRRWPVHWGMVALVVLLIAFPFLLKPLSSAALNMPEWGRILFAIAITAPLGFLMGLPFAGGLSVVEKRDPSLVPWAWAINGTFSVISSVLAVMIALSWGFPAVFWLGALAYFLALLSFHRLYRM